MAIRLFSHLNRSEKILKIIFSSAHFELSSNVNRSIHWTTINQKRIAFNLSDIGEGIREVTIKEWFVKEGDEVQQFDNLCEVQSDKASVTITSRYDGKILRLHHAVDGVALVGKPLIDFDVNDSENEAQIENESNEKGNEITDDKIVSEQTTTMAATTANSDEVKSVDNANERKIVLTTPAVRRIASENNVDLKSVRGSGPNGRVLKGDVLEHLNLIPASKKEARPVKISVPIPTPGATVVAGDRVEKLKGVQKAMFTSMTASLRIPHFSYCDEIDVTQLVAVRNDLKKNAESQGVKLTFMPFFIKAASLALAKFPILNSSLDEANESIVYKSSHNISIAMATSIGLVVPNIKNCEQKTLLDIATDLNALHERGKSGRLMPDDFANGTFSLSNIGVVGGTYTKPVIAPPQVAIGAIGATRVEPRFDAFDNVVKAQLINISWAADHRVIDGVTMASFSNEWKSYIEQPTRFILH